MDWCPAKGSPPRLAAAAIRTTTGAVIADQDHGGDLLAGLTKIRVQNYRALANVELTLGPINVVFGPNGAGKSTLLDSLYFFRDCAIRGVEVACSERDHGIGILWDGTAENQRIALDLTDGDITYSVSFSLSAGRIDPFPGERLSSSSRDIALIERRPGSDQAALFHTEIGQAPQIPLREPEKLSLGLFLVFNHGDEEAGHLDRLLHYVRFYHSRSFHLRPLKRAGSESSPQTRLWDVGNNAWSVLRNLQDKRNVDERYDTIMRHMNEAFPMFDDIVLEQTGPTTVYASFMEKGRRDGILASGASDGVVQMLLLLLALFSEGPRESVLLFDEPEVSLHPWAIGSVCESCQACCQAVEQTGVSCDALTSSDQPVRAPRDFGGGSRRWLCAIRTLVRNQRDSRLA